MEQYEIYKDDGDTALAIGELEDAVMNYRKAVETEPSYFDGWHALTMACIKLGLFDEAIAAGETATRLEPNNQFGWTSLSLAYVRADRIEDAEAAGAKAKVISWGGKIKTDDI